MKTYTIGFTKKTAEEFFESIKQSGIATIVDVRLRNDSQLAAFAKKNDLSYFLKEIGNINYVHLPELAPTREMLDEYKKNKGSWTSYESKFMNLMKARKIEELPKDIFNKGCLLCSENKPHFCHRRLILEYLNDKWGGKIEIVHL